MRTPAILWGILAFLVLAAGGVLILTTPDVGTIGWVHALGSHGVEWLGRPLAALTWLVLGGVLVVAVCWPLGLLAHALEDSVDWPVYHWVNTLYHQGWSELWWKLTNIGKPRVNQAFALLGALFFAVVWAVEDWGWWKPLIGLPLIYLVVKYGQIFLLTVVDRGHPPHAAGGRPTLGTYPSGGCARVILVYGTLIFLTVWWLWPTSAEAWYAGWTLTAFLWALQAYARMINNEHWLTDVIGGTIYGALLLVVATTSFRLLLW
jgi:hypothetical protein